MHTSGDDSRNCLACMAPLPMAFQAGGRHYCDGECKYHFLLEREGRSVVPYYAMTHEEIGSRLGISRQMVQTIEKRALEKLAAAWALMEAAE